MRRLVLALGASALLAVAAFSPVSAAASGRPANQPPPEQCPVVVASTTLLTDCVGPLMVLSDHVIVNLGDHEILCTGARDGVVLLNRFKVQVLNGVIRGCRNGIRVDGGGEHDFSDLEILGGTNGINVRLSSGNRLRGIDIRATTLMGVVLATSSGNHLTNLSVSEAGSGVYLSRAAVGLAGSVDNRLERLQIVNSRLDGLVLDFDSNDNTLHFSRVSGSGRAALYLWGSRNLIVGNTFRATRGSQPALPGNGTGLLAIGPSNDNVIRLNDASNNARYGIQVLGQRNQIEANRASNNGEAGITAGAAPEASAGVGNRFRANFTLRNGQHDLADYPPGPCTLNVWTLNQGVKLYDGCEKG